MATVALSMVLTPGPNMMYLVSRSVSQGRRAGLTSLAGTGVGFIIYMIMANVGLAAVFIVVPWLYIGLKAVGAAYLFYLAWRTLKPGGVSLFEAHAVASDSRSRLFRMGLTTNLLNPKSAIMYLALIPQFIHPHSGNVMLQGFVLGAVQISISLFVNGVIICAAGGVAAFAKSRPKWALWQRWMTGTLLGAVGTRLAVEALTSASV
jgi:threonine/homoserine/homoserine lactone efflux protein